MNDQRVAILDASYSPFAFIREKTTVESSDDNLGLQPIPKFAEIVTDAAKSAMLSGEYRPGSIAIIDVGVVCSTCAVQVVGRAIHSRIAELDVWR